MSPTENRYPHAPTKIIVAADGDVVTAATDTALIGESLYEIEGVEEVFGPDFRFVAATRDPLTVQRMWQGAVWEPVIEPFGVRGAYVEATERVRVVNSDLLTLAAYVDLSGRVSAALAAGEDNDA
jgi:hypothetical protein